MRELIGPCAECGTPVYCENGFLNGTNEEGELLCFNCAEERRDESEHDDIKY